MPYRPPGRNRRAASAMMATFWLALHRQHGFTINHARLCVRQARPVRIRNEALPPEAFKIISNDPSGVFIVFNPDVGMRLSGNGQAGGYPKTRAKFDYIIVGLNV